MADPFSTGAGIVGVIGLTIQIMQAILHLGMDWKDAPENIKTFMTELKTLKTVLSETNMNILVNPDYANAFQSRPSLVLSQLGPQAPPTTDANLLLETCRIKLISLLEELKKRSQGCRLGWERLKGAFQAKETRESVENLCRHCQTLNNMLSIDSAVLGATLYKEVAEGREEQREWHQAEAEMSSAIKEGLDESVRRQENQERERERETILDWLTPIDFVPQQHDLFTRRQEGTGQWLLNSAEFMGWVETSKQILYCPGIPGAGKTILTSIVIDDLITRFHNDSSVGIAYLYCNFQRQHEQTPESLIASLLKQLLKRLPLIPESVKDSYDQHKRKQKRPSYDEIVKILESVINMYSRTYIMIDALDECQSSCKWKLLSSALSLRDMTEANIFATSRLMPDIENEFKGCVSLEIAASEDDIRRYLKGHISQLPKFILSKPALQEEIETTIVQTAEGMFLLAQLYLTSLEDKTTVKAMKTTLKQLQKKSQVASEDGKLKILSLAYEQVMERINGQQAGFQQLAINVLSWITCAKRPLTITELQHAMAVEIGETVLDEDNLHEIEDMLSVCMGLVTIDEESGIIRLVHYTTQEFFQRTQKNWFPNAEADITTICVSYLSYDHFEAGVCNDKREFRERLRLHPLYDYAARNWGHHAHEAPGKAMQPILHLLENPNKRSAVYQAWYSPRRSRLPQLYLRPFPEQITGIHLASLFGLSEVILALIKNGHDPDRKNSEGETPLSWAVDFERMSVVKLLVKEGADLESTDNYGKSPMERAIENGNEVVIRLLIEMGANLEAKDDMLLLAVTKSHESIVRLLLELGAQITAAVLTRALFNGRDAIIKLLLVAGEVDINSKDTWGRTKLSYAASRGQEAIVKMLLENGANIESKDKYNQTPLSIAAYYGRELIIKMLLENGANIESKDNDNQTPLAIAAQSGREAIVKTLLENGANIESKDKYNWTPLFYAARSGSEAIVKMLLENGANIESKDNDNQTPLLIAAFCGREAIVKMLLENGANIESKDYDNQTPLLIAAQGESAAIIRILLKNGANIESKDNYNRTPLLIAVRSESEGIVKTLLENGANADAEDINGQTPLSEAIKYGYKGVVRILQEHIK